MFKLACLVRQALCSEMPMYLADDIHLIFEGNRRSFRSSSDNMCAVPLRTTASETEAFALPVREFGTVCHVACEHLTSATNIIKHHWRHICVTRPRCFVAFCISALEILLLTYLIIRTVHITMLYDASLWVNYVKAWLKRWLCKSQQRDTVLVEAWMDAGRLFHTAGLAWLIILIQSFTSVIWGVAWKVSRGACYEGSLLRKWNKISSQGRGPQRQSFGLPKVIFRSRVAKNFLGLLPQTRPTTKIWINPS